MTKIGQIGKASLAGSQTMGDQAAPQHSRTAWQYFERAAVPAKWFAGQAL
jgi:hypothetical protein